MSKVIKIVSNSTITDFVNENEHDFVAVLGLDVDNKHRILWAISNYDYYKENTPKEKLGTCRMYKINLEDGSVINRYELEQNEHHLFNDLSVITYGNLNTYELAHLDSVRLSRKQGEGKPIWLIQHKDDLVPIHFSNFCSNLTISYVVLLKR